MLGITQNQKMQLHSAAIGNQGRFIGLFSEMLQP
uniref:Uncharacterized protein n=1 Tax=Arundo donax TaxID=35708 RepID=A0A0A9CAK2_ARUDO